PVRRGRDRGGADDGARARALCRAPARGLKRAALIGVLVLVGVLAAGTRHATSAAQGCATRPVITEHRIARPGWVSGAIVTEYYAIRESWFTGKLVTAPGLSGRHRVDWLYAVHGVAMNGEG